MSRPLLVALLALLVPLPGRAQPPAHDAREARLVGFSRAELARIEPLTERGVFGLVDRSEGPLLPAVHLAVLAEAPAAVVADLLSDPAGYPDVIPAVSDATVTERSGGVTGFSWSWRAPVGTLEGDAMMTALGGGGPRGARIVIERTRGDLGRGREVWRVLPRGPRRCLLLLSSRVDVRGAGPLGASRGSISLNRSINAAMALGMVLRIADAAERRAGAPRPPRPEGLHRPELPLGALEPLMRRGDLFLLESDHGALRQAVLMTRYNRTEAQVRDVLLDPPALVNGLLSRTHVEVRDDSDERVRFGWRVDHPLLGAGGTMALRERPDDVIELDAVDGTLAGGRWRFETRRLPSRATAVVGWARFDVGDANPLLRSLVDTDASLGSGLTASSWVALAWAVRHRLRRVPATGVHRHMR